MNRYAFVLLVAAIASVATLSGCGNGGASEPPQTSYDPGATSKLQFAVGVATIGYNHGQSSAQGLNIVETLRQSNGLSGVLYSVPMIIGPSKFDVFISTEGGGEVQYAGSDLGTNHITWGTLNQEHWTGPPREQKVPSSGAFGYGLCPCNSDGGPVNGTSPLYQAYSMPIYGNDVALWYGGPPAFPQGGPSLVALGWEGYSLGFTDFAVQPVIGTYRFYAAVPPAYNTPQDPTPSPNPNGTPTPAPGILAGAAQLTKLKGLPLFQTPTFVPDSEGGGTVNIQLPAGAQEAMTVIEAVGGSGQGICVQSHEANSFYTLVSHSSGNVVLDDMLGPLTQSGQKTPTICPGETYEIYSAGTDYPAYEASYPQNLQQLPLITGNNGQADVSTSDLLIAAYPTSAPH
jgi:hypothetical protein